MYTGNHGFIHQFRWKRKFDFSLNVIIFLKQQYQKQLIKQSPNPTSRNGWQATLQWAMLNEELFTNGFAAKKDDLKVSIQAQKDTR